LKVRIIAFSTKGCATAKRVAEALEGEEVSLFSKTTADNLGLTSVTTSMRTWTKESFEEADAIVFVGAVGIAVREIVPFVKSKSVDPAVVSIDELARFTIPLLSGHIGGANEFALRIAGAIGSTPVVTTATDINGKIAIDAFAVTHDLSILNLKTAKDIASRILSDDPVGLVSDFPVEGEVPPELSAGPDAPSIVLISDKVRKPPKGTLVLIPRRRTVGIGCRRGTPQEAIEEVVSRVLQDAGIPYDTVRAFASIDLKKDEEGLLSFAAAHRTPITFYTSEELNALPGDFSKSDFVRSVTSVDCVCERSAVMVSRGGKIIVRKTAENGVTVAVAEEPFTVKFDRKGKR
jgi:cobalt-precorrin 5A hydrolase